MTKSHRICVYFTQFCVNITQICVNFLSQSIKENSKTICRSFNMLFRIPFQSKDPCIKERNKQQNIKMCLKSKATIRKVFCFSQTIKCFVVWNIILPSYTILASVQQAKDFHPINKTRHYLFVTLKNRLRHIEPLSHISTIFVIWSNRYSLLSKTTSFHCKFIPFKDSMD
jgi:hypothetical protein